jgi:hypothetical protein
VNSRVARALDRLETYLGRVRAGTGPAATARSIYQAMSDVAELGEIARRLYVALESAAREHTLEAEVNKKSFER